jgi:hypothetical protein
MQSSLDFPVSLSRSISDVAIRAAGGSPREVTNLLAAPFSSG